MAELENYTADETFADDDQADDEDDLTIDDDLEELEPLEELDDDVAAVIPVDGVVAEGEEDEEDEEEDEAEEEVELEEVDETLAEDDEEEASLDVLLSRDKALEVDDLGRLEEPRDGLTVPAQPIGAGEFTCRSCFLVKNRAQMTDEDELICFDCA